MRDAERGRQAEAQIDPLRAADPVALHRLDRIGPAVQFVQPGEELLGIIRDLQEPLRNRTALDHRAGAPAAPVDHLFVGQHGLVDRIPVDLGILAVGQALFHQPREHQLFPAVIIRRAGRELARPVVGKTQALELAPHMLDVGVSPARGRGSVLDRRVLGRQPEGVPTHRLQHVLAPHPVVAADDVADGVIPHVAHVKCAGRIRQHGEAVEFFSARFFVHFEGFPGLPALLHPDLDFGRIVRRRCHRFRVPSDMPRSGPEA